MGLWLTKIVELHLNLSQKLSNAHYEAHFVELLHGSTEKTAMTTILDLSMLHHSMFTLGENQNLAWNQAGDRTPREPKISNHGIDLQAY